jgi:hypothetical protein
MYNQTMARHAKKIKAIGAAAFALWIIWVLAVAEDAYNLSVDYRVEICVCLFVCLLYFVFLAFLLKAKSDLSKISVTFLTVFGFIALIAFLLFGFLLNPWFWVVLLSLGQDIASKVHIIL